MDDQKIMPAFTPEDVEALETPVAGDGIGWLTRAWAAEAIEASNHVGDGLHDRPRLMRRLGALALLRYFTQEMVDALWYAHSAFVDRSISGDPDDEKEIALQRAAIERIEALLPRRADRSEERENA